MKEDSNIPQPFSDEWIDYMVALGHEMFKAFRLPTLPTHRPGLSEVEINAVPDFPEDHPLISERPTNPPLCSVLIDGKLTICETPDELRKLLEDILADDSL